MAGRPTPIFENDEGIMRFRPIVVFELALIASVIASTALRAQINPFSDYYDNVARAARQNDTAQVRSLAADSGNNPNQVDDQSRTALHYGAMNGNLTIIAIMVKAKAHLDEKDKLGDTPLHWAAERNQVDAVQLLLDVGAQVDPENKNGMTPLMVAASRGNIEIVQALLKKGASVTKTDFTGRDAAGWAVESHRPAVVQAIKRAQTAKHS
jgi:ankyrin repeat protein